MTQIEGPGSNVITLGGGAVEEHDEPATIDGGGAPKFVLFRGIDGPDEPTVIWRGDHLGEAMDQFEQADPEDGYVQLVEDGQVIEAKRAGVTSTVTTEPPEPKPGEQASAFDQKPFTAKRPEVDGVETDTMKVSFSGTWELNPMVATDVEFFNKLQRGQSVDLRVEVEITDRSAPYKRNANGEETITGIAKAKVVHVYRLTPEQL